MPDGPKRAPGRYEVPSTVNSKTPKRYKCSIYPYQRGHLVDVSYSTLPELGVRSLTDEGNVVFHVLANKTRVIRDPAEGGDAGEDRIGLTHVN
jgi:hypothetical protein